MASHSVQRIWMGFGMRPPYNQQMVIGGRFCRETARRPRTVGSFRMRHVEAAAAAISRPCNVLLPLLRAVGCTSYSRGETATGRLEAGQLCNSTWCVCLLAQELHIACCRICTYASFQLSHCQTHCCSCCRFAGLAPANNIGLTQQYFLYTSALVI